MFTVVMSVCMHADATVVFHCTVSNDFMVNQVLQISGFPGAAKQECLDCFTRPHQNSVNVSQEMLMLTHTLAMALHYATEVVIEKVQHKHKTGLKAAYCIALCMLLCHHHAEGCRQLLTW